MEKDREREMRGDSSRVLAVWVACVLFPAALVLVTWSEPKAWFSSDIAVKMLQAEACAQSDCVIPYPAEGSDPEQKFRPIQYPFAEPAVDGGGYISIYGNLLIRGAALFYPFFGAFGTLVIPMLSFFVLLAGCLRLGGSIGLAPWLSVLSGGLMTGTWFYAAVFWEHLPATASFIWALILLLDLSCSQQEYSGSLRSRLRQICVAALAAALSIALRPESVLAIFAFGFFLLLEAKGTSRVALISVAALLSSLLGLLFWLAPQLLPTAQLQHNITEHGFDLTLWLSQRVDHGINALAGVYEQGYSHRNKPSYLISSSIALGWIVLTVLGGARKNLRVWELCLRFFGASVATLLPLLYMDQTGPAQSLGLLVLSPIFFFLPLSASSNRKCVLIRGSLVFLCLCFLTMPNEGGLQIGARYLLLVCPILALLALDFLRHHTAQRMKVAFPAVIALTLAAQGLAFTHLCFVDHEKDRSVAQIQALDPDAYATTDGFLACELTALVWPKPVFFVPDPVQPGPLVTVMRNRGVKKLVMIENLPRNPPSGVVFFGPYRLKSILPTPWYPLPIKATWLFEIPPT